MADGGTDGPTDRPTEKLCWKSPQLLLETEGREKLALHCSNMSTYVPAEDLTKIGLRLWLFCCIALTFDRGQGTI